MVTTGIHTVNLRYSLDVLLNGTRSPRCVAKAASCFSQPDVTFYSLSLSPYNKYIHPCETKTIISTIFVSYRRLLSRIYKTLRRWIRRLFRNYENNCYSLTMHSRHIWGTPQQQVCNNHNEVQDYGKTSNIAAVKYCLAYISLWNDKVEAS